MKKIIISLILVSCIFILTGCRSKNNSNNKDIFNNNQQEKVNDNTNTNNNNNNIVNDDIVSSDDYVVCTQSSSGVDIEMTTKLTDNHISAMSVSWEMSLATYNEAQIESVSKQDFCLTVKQSMAQYSFASCKQSIIGKTLVINAEIDVDAITDQSFKGSATPLEIENALEKVGYTCIIK